MSLKSFSCVLILWWTSAAEVIKVKPGEDVTLQFWGPRNSSIAVIKWIRPDLNSEGFVFYRRDNRSFEDFQHPSFHRRVQLRDPNLKDGDVSVILKNVSSNDTGTYECRIIIEKKGDESKGTDIRHFIYLKVEDPVGQTRDGGNMNEGHGHVGLAAGLSVAVVILLAVGFFCVLCCFFKKKKKKSDLKTLEENGEL